MVDYSQNGDTELPELDLIPCDPAVNVGNML